MSKIITIFALLSTIATAGCDQLGIPEAPGSQNPAADVPVCMNADGCKTPDQPIDDFKTP